MAGFSFGWFYILSAVLDPLSRTGVFFAGLPGKTFSNVGIIIGISKPSSSMKYGLIRTMLEKHTINRAMPLKERWKKRKNSYL